MCANEICRNSANKKNWKNLNTQPVNPLRIYDGSLWLRQGVEWLVPERYSCLDFSLILLCIELTAQPSIFKSPLTPMVCRQKHVHSVLLSFFLHLFILDCLRSQACVDWTLYFSFLVLLW